MSRTALDGYVIKAIEKDYLLDLIKRLSTVYFVEVLGFCIMGNHFHLMARMYPGDCYDDDEVMRRFCRYYGVDGDKYLEDGRIRFFREEWSNLSEYVREIKQTFSRFYNKRHDPKSYTQVLGEGNYGSQLE